PGRVTRAIEVTYTAAETHAHGLLAQYAALRREAPGLAHGQANDLVTLLLKKRLFSGPAAFARTLHGYVDSRGARSPAARLAGAAGPATGGAAGPTTGGPDVLPGWLADALDWDSEPDDDEAGGDEERALLDRIADLGPASSVLEEAMLAQLVDWADRHGEPADSKAKALIAELNRICRPGGAWTHERVIVFTEYLATQDWLAGLLDARGLGGDRMGLLHGGMDERKREHLKAAFQAAPARSPLRILLATDAASEGIDLQRHCHRVIHYDIPFNPNRLEQRIGRVDRHGQRHQVEVAHFVGAGWQHAQAGSYEGDLEYLSRVAVKVAAERKDLGSVNPVLASAVEARMLGRPVLVDPLTVPVRVPASLLRAEENLRGQVARLREQLDASVRDLHVAPANVRRVVDTALALASQPPLADLDDAPGSPGGLVAPPDLRAGWERTVTGLADPLSGVPRPLTFDPALAQDRDDVVLAHLEQPLVAQATRLLRSAIWGGRTPLHRIAAVRVAIPGEASLDGEASMDGLLVAVFARLVIVGADGGR
ncbi:MAG: helicase-related protein, partial [Streptosporangiaceae bacterium]